LRREGAKAEQERGERDSEDTGASVFEADREHVARCIDEEVATCVAEMRSQTSGPASAAKADTRRTLARRSRRMSRTATAAAMAERMIPTMTAGQVGIRSLLSAS
jgi:hypothetical protein